MQIDMAFSTEHHGLPLPFTHLAFPHRFAFEIFQLPNMMYLTRIRLYSAPLAFVSSKALTEFGCSTVDLCVGYAVKIIVCDRGPFELAG